MMNDEIQNTLPADRRRFDLEDRLVTFSSLIIDIVEKLPENRVGNHIAGQVLRSGTSPAPNYAEATSAESRQDFIHKLKIGLKELRETNVWLRVILRKKLAESGLVERVLTECNELIAILVTSIATAQKNIKRK